MILMQMNVAYHSEKHPKSFLSDSYPCQIVDLLLHILP